MTIPIYTILTLPVSKVWKWRLGIKVADVLLCAVASMYYLM